MLEIESALMCAIMGEPDVDKEIYAGTHLWRWELGPNWLRVWGQMNGGSWACWDSATTLAERYTDFGDVLAWLKRSSA